MPLQNTITGILGCKGSGKSTKAKSLFLKSKRVLCIDTMEEYSGCLKIVGEPEKVAEYIIRNKKFRIAYVPKSAEDEAEFEKLCQIAYAASDVDVVVEEIDYYCNSQGANPGLEQLVRRGRHRKVNLIYTTRRFQEISRNLTANTDYYYIYRVAEPVDVDIVKKRFGGDIADKVISLPNYQCVEIDIRARNLVNRSDNNEPQEIGGVGVVRNNSSLGSPMGEYQSSSEISRQHPDSTESNSSET